MPVGSHVSEALRPLFQLTTGAVHIWYADILAPVTALTHLERVLSPEEAQRAARFLLEADRRRSVVARATLRLLLEEYSGIPAREAPITLTAHGKPFLAGSDLRFNVSHSGSWVLLAFARGREIGVDIEAVRRGLDLEGLASACFSSDERRWVFEKEEEVSGRFFQQWACKESWIKADGRGLSLPLPSYSVLSRANMAGRYRVLDHSGNELNWTTRPLPCAEGYRAAITAAGEDWSCSIFPADEHMHF